MTWQRLDDKYTKSLLHCDGVDGSTTFRDESGKTWTASGNAQIDTAQSKFGGGSILFDGTTDAVRPSSASVDFAFGTGDFSIDFWIRVSSFSALNMLYVQENGDFRIRTGTNVSNAIVLDSNPGPTFITGTTALSTGTWYHVALGRSGSNTKLFLNGIQEGSTYVASTNYGTSAQTPFVGMGTDTNWSFNGWLDELRISKGIARWTGNFTVPTRPYMPMMPVQVN